MKGNNMWESFISGDPILDSLIEEAAMKTVDSDDDPTPEESGNPNVEQIAQQFAQGQISEDDLVKMYQSGSLTKEDIQQILGMVEGQGDQQEEVDPEEILAQQIDQVNDSFIRFALYDKINDLENKLKNFLENFTEVQSQEYDDVGRIMEFLKILSSLAFSLDISVLYQMYGNLELKLVEIFKNLQEKQALEIAQEKSEDLLKDHQLKAEPELDATIKDNIDIEQKLSED